MMTMGLCLQYGGTRSNPGSLDLIVRWPGVRVTRLTVTIVEWRGVSGFRAGTKA